VRGGAGRERFKKEAMSSSRTTEARIPAILELRMSWSVGDFPAYPAPLASSLGRWTA